MNIIYLGHLAQDDPLHGYLRDHIAPQIGTWSAHVEYRVFRHAFSPSVYLYEDRQTGSRVIGKFFQAKGRPGFGAPRRTAEGEFHNLLFLRRLGLDAAPHYVARPLGCNPSIGDLLVIEFLHGELLSGIIENAIHHGQSHRLFRKLTGLAWFLATLHNRTAGDWTVNFHESRDYLSRLIHTLAVKRDLGREHADELHWLGDRWQNRGVMWEDRNVMVQGDATPSNFLFGRGLEVMAIDLERMKWADRVFDVGRLCGELKHFFFRATGDPWAAEPFIGHFLWEYACHFPDRDAAFRSITRRLPYYMGVTLLRIARNWWIDNQYRWRLITEAKQILRALP